MDQNDETLLDRPENEDGEKKTVGLTDKGKEVLKAAKANPKGGINRNEKILVQLEDGYMFCNVVDGIVRFRTDLQHADILEGNKFQEPSPRPQSPNGPAR